MQILHPFMPFITEEIWHCLRERGENEAIMLTRMPQFNPSECNRDLLTRFENTQKVVEDIRRVRAQKNIAQKFAIELYVNKNQKEADKEMDSVISKLCNVCSIRYVNDKVDDAISFLEQNVEYFIPFSENINKEEELAKLNADLKYAEGFLQSVLKKLANEKFVAGAPEAVIALERKKQSDAEDKIKILKEKIAKLN